MPHEFLAVYAELPALYAGSEFLIGLVVGSFLNVVIHRVPIMLERDWRAQAADILQPAAAVDSAPPAVEPKYNLVTPGSACPACKAPIRAWQNIPLLSWVLLRGRCAACQVKISARYPLVELATGLLSAAVAWHFGVGAAGICGLLVTWCLIPLAAIDIDHQLLPDTITLPLMWAGLLAAAVFGATPGIALPVTPREAIIGAAAGYLSLWLVYQSYKLITGREGMGYGDFKLLAALGAWMGWTILPVVILLSAFTGAAIGIGLIVLRGRDHQLPLSYGPYLAAAGWLAMLYGQQLIDLYLRLSGMRHGPA